MGFMAGKRALIIGLASDRSIAYGIAEAMRREGAELAFSYVGERFRERVTDMAKELGSDIVFEMDVGSDEQIDAGFATLASHWDGLDVLVHSVAFAPREAIAAVLDARSLAEMRVLAETADDAIMYHI